MHLHTLNLCTKFHIHKKYLERGDKCFNTTKGLTIMVVHVVLNLLHLFHLKEVKSSFLTHLEHPIWLKVVEETSAQTCQFENLVENSKL